MKNELKQTEIKRRDTDEVIHSGDFDSIRECLEEDKQESHKDYLMAIDYANWSFDMEEK